MRPARDAKKTSPGCFVAKRGGRGDRIYCRSLTPEPPMPHRVYPRPRTPLAVMMFLCCAVAALAGARARADRKSTRLNSSHQIISYAVFCLKKKNMQRTNIVYRHLVLL